MALSTKCGTGLFLGLLCLASGGLAPAHAGVSPAVQEAYRAQYVNKAMFMKIPIYSARQVVDVGGGSFRAVPQTTPPVYKVGDQFRILRIDFGRDEIKFRLSGITSPGEAEVVYKFPSELEEAFPGREAFDRALEGTFTEGLRYADIEQARIGFLEGEFDRSIDRLAEAASSDRATVLARVAPLIPDYREVRGERDALAAEVERISAELARAKAGTAGLEAKLGEREGEIARLQSAQAAMQKNLAGSGGRIETLEAQLRESAGRVRTFESEIAAIRRSLDAEAGSNRDLTRSNAELAERIQGMQADLREREAANVRLAGEIEGLKAEIGEKESTIRTLTSNKDSLGRQYVEMKEEKEKLDAFALAVRSLRTRIVEEKTGKGFYEARAGVYAGEVLLGHLQWSVPSALAHNESKAARATFRAESIDDVKVDPGERQLLRTLGERLQIRLDLEPGSPSMAVDPGQEGGAREIGERQEFTWEWHIRNGGTQDCPVVLAAHVQNRHGEAVPLLRKGHVIAASNPVRLIRSYLEPVPMAVGAVLGFLLFGIVGIFRKPARRRRTPPDSGAAAAPRVNAKKL